MHWLYWTGKTVEFISDQDVEVAGGDELARAYDLIVYEGHTEYVTEAERDAVERYRDLGGNLMFLSANNFFWKVKRAGGALTKVTKWRDAGRPEAALIGVQYLANDRGERQGALRRPERAAPWLWQGTDLAPGSTFGESSAATGSRSTTSPPRRRRGRSSSPRSPTCSARG